MQRLQLKKAQGMEKSSLAKNVNWMRKNKQNPVKARLRQGR